MSALLDIRDLQAGVDGQPIFERPFPVDKCR